MSLITDCRKALTTAGYDPKSRRRYENWIRRFLDFWHQPEPAALDTAAAHGFLQHLATQRKVAPSTYNQARQALNFLYEQVLQKTVQLPAKLKQRLGKRRVCLYLTRAELAQLHRHLTPEMALIVDLLSQCGLRASECIRLRVRDLDFAHQRIHVRSDTGKEQRSTNMPVGLIPKLRLQLQNRQTVWREDRRCRSGFTTIPTTLKKTHPENARLWQWQYVFSDPRLEAMPTSHQLCRGPMQALRLRTAIRETAHRLGMRDQLHPDDIRHSTAVHMMQDGWPIKTLRQYLGHRHLLTTVLLTSRMNTGTPALWLANDRF